MLFILFQEDIMAEMNINIRIPKELHTYLKVKASKEGITLKEKIINILKEGK